MRTSLVLLSGLGLMLAACNSGGPNGAGITPLPAGTAPNSSSTISPIQGQDDLGPGRAGAGSSSEGRGAPTAGTGTINPIQGNNSQPARPGMGSPSAGSSTTSPIQGQDDRGPGIR
ncbi:hypothetical protein [Teichococcus vastitatis]|uniref:Lipoprotein n=1 Tax=Teichococcus vastitatis TaxID=2307076 RepID=A0ABS9WB62_9PROT|nr:hypothetical protein [Pseudoroseomonas vastitatis]MCI0756541.1 hypothetical protein [Pseudoroseomonas vastitatis]